MNTQIETASLDVAARSASQDAERSALVRELRSTADAARHVPADARYRVIWVRSTHSGPQVREFRTLDAVGRWVALLRANRDAGELRRVAVIDKRTGKPLGAAVTVADKRRQLAARAH